VLIHGAGDTARVWDAVIDELGRRGRAAVAVDLLGRRRRPFDLTRVTLPDAADAAAADIGAIVRGPVVLVGHSAGGMVLPFLAARLPDVVHLVFVAGLVAADGCQVVDSVAPERRAAMEDHRRELRARHRGHTFGGWAPGEERSDNGLAVLDDERLVQGIESLNLMFQTISWAGVPDALPRTFVRCLRDPIQSRAIQARLIAGAAASEVIELDTGHSPARSVPEELAAILAAVATRT
jgi:pimeloyl-ACP methyl ester carboxylesterase